MTIGNTKKTALALPQDLKDEIARNASLAERGFAIVGIRYISPSLLPTHLPAGATHMWVDLR